MSQDLMASRYGKTKSTKSRERIIFGTLAAALLAGFLTWAALTSIATANGVVTKTLGYEIKSPTQAWVNIQITAPTGGNIGCDVKVLNQSYGVVGYRQIDLQLAANETTTKEIFVNTTELGVTGLVDKCWVK